MRRVSVALFSAAVAAGVVSTLRADVTIDETTVVKTGSETAEIAAAEIGARSVRVEAGTLRVVQSENTTARYVRFTVREKNPWRTQNAGDLTQMDSFELVLGDALVAYPEGTTAVNSDGSVGKAPNVLTYDRAEEMNWQAKTSQIDGFTIDMGSPVEFNGYALAAATISTGRTPYSFTVEVGVDDGQGGVSWHLFDDRRQYCTCGYGKDWFTGQSGYSPRMPPVYAPNPLPVFAPDATVTVAADAVLELVGVAGRLPNLAGEGVVRLEDARPELTGACSFSGAFDGYGCLTFAMDGEQVGAFTFADFSIRVTNAERARTWTVGGEGGSYKLPLAEDSAEAPLHLRIAGAVETPSLPRRVDRFGDPVPFVRHGTTTVLDASAPQPVFLSTAPALIKHFRYLPITGHGAYVEQADEIKFYRDDTLQDATDVQFAYMDAYRTVNYTSGALIDQDANTLSPGKTAEVAKLFDSDTSTYFQYNQPEAARGDLANTPGLTVTFRRAKSVDRFEFWQPTYAAASNPAYWPGKWRLETSVDGNVWEVLDDQSGELVDQSRLYTGWPPVVTTPVASGTVPRADAWFAPDACELAADTEIRGELKYLRLFLRELSNSSEVTNGASYIDIGELEIHRDGAKVAWPEGTVCYRTDGLKTLEPGLINAPAAMPNDAWNGSAENEVVDGGGDAANAQRAIWNPGYEQLCQGAGFVVEMPEAVAFDRYKLYAGYNQDGNYRIPSKWTLDVSYDGKNWTAVDSADREQGFDVPSVWSVFQFFVSRTVDFSSVGRLASEAFADTVSVTVAAGASLTLTTADETVGALGGEGTVALNDASLTLAGGESTFAGTVTSANGELIVDGGTLTLLKADLRRLEKIVLKNGAVLKGRAFCSPGLVVETGAGCENDLRPISGLILYVR